MSTLEGNVSRIAETNIEFNRLKETQQKRDEWFLEGFVLSLASRGVFLKAGECFGFEKPPVLGGAIEIGNIKPFPVIVWQSIMGQLHEQLAKRPPGSKISGFVFKE